MLVLCKLQSYRNFKSEKEGALDKIVLLYINAVAWHVLESISPTLYEQLFRQFTNAKKLQTQTVSTEKLRKTLSYQNSWSDHKMLVKLTPRRGLSSPCSIFSFRRAWVVLACFCPLGFQNLIGCKPERKTEHKMKSKRLSKSIQWKKHCSEKGFWNLRNELSTSKWYRAL